MQTWTIYSDGRIETNFAGSFKVPPARVTVLLEELELVGFYGLSDDYPGNDCADCKAYFITVNKTDRTKHVEAVDNSRLPEPAQLSITLLLAFVDSL